MRKTLLLLMGLILLSHNAEATMPDTSSLRSHNAKQNQKSEVSGAFMDAPMYLSLGLFDGDVNSFGWGMSPRWCLAAYGQFGIGLGFHIGGLLPTWDDETKDLLGIESLGIIQFMVPITVNMALAEDCRIISSLGFGGAAWMIGMPYPYEDVNEFEPCSEFSVGVQLFKTLEVSFYSFHSNLKVFSEGSRFDRGIRIAINLGA